MSDRDPLVAAALDRVAPDPAADWDDVLRRARRRPRAWLVVAAAAAVAALASSALAFGDGILDWFTGSPAPPSVENRMELHNRPSRGVLARLEHSPGVRAAQTRGAVAIETAAGRVAIWTAPKDSGGECYLIEIAGSDGGMGCDGPGKWRGPPLTAGYREIPPRDLRLVEGRLFDPAVSVEIRLAGGGTMPVAVGGGHFLGEIPDGERPALAVAYDAEGRQVARHRFHTYAPLRLQFPPADRFQTLIETKAWNGQAVRLRVAELPDGRVCSTVGVAGGVGGTCGKQAPVVLQHTIAEHNETDEGGVAVLHGRSGEQVATVEVRFEDGDRVRLRPVEGYFLHALDPRHHRLGHQPDEVVAYDAAGNVVAREDARGPG